MGPAIGIVGAAAYQWVRPWLLGPPWLRRLSLALASGAVVGAMLVHPDGIDFTVPTPTWLAVTTFVLLPATFGAVIGPAVDTIEARAARTDPASHRRSWILPVALVALFPLTVVSLAIAAAVLLAWTASRNQTPAATTLHRPFTSIAARTAWLTVALAGAAALVHDILQLNEAT